MKESQNQTNQFKDSGDLLVEIFNRYCEYHRENHMKGRKVSKTEFKQYLDRLIRTDIKPLLK